MSMNAYLAALTAQRIEEFRRDPDSLVEFLEELDQSENELRLRKMWQATHFMMTGTAWNTSGPLGQAIMGGEDIGPDIGYGPARFLTPPQVQETAQALAKLSMADFRKGFAPEVMEREDIYPSSIWVREKDTVVVELAQLFEDLVSFYRGAASRNDAVLLWMS
jgi:hypothetical protein